MILLCNIILDHVSFVTLGYMFEKNDLTALPFQEEKHLQFGEGNDCLMP